jgi:hypothetical protein
MFLLLIGGVVASLSTADEVVHNKKSTQYVQFDTTGMDSTRYTDTLIFGKNTVGGRNSTNCLYGRFIVGAWTDTVDTGDGTGDTIGIDDSCTIWLYAVFDDYPYTQLATVKKADLPCTLTVRIPSDSAGVDTLFKERLALVWELYDAFADSVFETSVVVELDYFTRGPK